MNSNVRSNERYTGISLSLLLNRVEIFGGAGRRGILILHSRSFFTKVPHPEVLSSLLGKSRPRKRECMEAANIGLEIRLKVWRIPLKFRITLSKRFPNPTIHFSNADFFMPACNSVNSRILRIPLQTLEKMIENP